MRESKLIHYNYDGMKSENTQPFTKMTMCNTSDMIRQSNSNERFTNQSMLRLGENGSAAMSPKVFKTNHLSHIISSEVDIALPAINPGISRIENPSNMLI